MKIKNKTKQTELKQAKEEFGMLLRKIEYLINHSETNKVDLHAILKNAIEFRDLLEKL